MKKNTAPTAFTLIELLVVIAIIAILASIALPAFTGVQKRAKQTKDMSNAKQIVLALKQFAIDNNGVFPANAPAATYSAGTALTAANVSNDAFWWLFPTYLTDENLFIVGGSHWCKAQADNHLDNPPTTRVNTLAPGENAYAYVIGLNDTSNSGFPLVADAFIKGAAAPWSYITDNSQPGGVWAGAKGVVAFVDGSAQVMTCNDATDVSIFRPGTTTAGNTIFTQSTDAGITWLGATNIVLNPDTTGVPYP